MCEIYMSSHCPNLTTARYHSNKEILFLENFTLLFCARKSSVALTPNTLEAHPITKCYGLYWSQSWFTQITYLTSFNFSNLFMFSKSLSSAMLLIQVISLDSSECSPLASFPPPRFLCTRWLMSWLSNQNRIYPLVSNNAFRFILLLWCGDN